MSQRKEVQEESRISYQIPGINRVPHKAVRTSRYELALCRNKPDIPT